MTARLRAALPLAAVLLVAAALRLVGRDWDSGHHLHPDERFLTMVETSLKWPGGLAGWFDEARSTLNPRNVGFPFFAYGTLPTTLTKGVSVALKKTDFHSAALVGRALAAAFDLGTVLLVFLLAKTLHRERRVALLAASFYAASVLALQHAHFFVSDPFVVFFVAAAAWRLARLQQDGRLADFLLAGALFGLALACKLSVATFVVPFTLVALAVARRAAREAPAGAGRAAAEAVLFRLVLAGAAAFLAFRVAQPDAFTGPGLLGIAPSPRFLANVREVAGLVNGDGDTPPGYQWAGRTPLLYPLVNLAVWGLGPLLGIAACAGFLWAAWRLVARGDGVHLIPVSWVAVLFLHQGTQLVTAMRYFLPIYPFLAVLAAWALVRAVDLARERRERWARAVRALPVAVAAGTLLWAVAFARIYTREHTRVAASRWLYEHAAPGTAIAVEKWDDPLPLRMFGKDPYGGLFHGIQMTWTDDETPAKLEKALTWLDDAELIVLSSNRLCDTIPRLPPRFPLAIRYYGALFDGSLGFEKVAEFTSFPGLLGLAVNDEDAEEAFSVYDHPRVRIFRKTARYTHEAAATALGEPDWGAVVRFTPRQARGAPGGLVIPARDVPRFRAAGTWSDLFTREGPAGRTPLLVWVVLVELLGLAAFPLVFAACPGLPDRGLALARTLGLLLVAWLVFLAASLRLATFTGGTVLAAVLLLALAGGAAARRERTRLAAFLREKRELVVAQEALFWGAFLLFVLVRRANPDLWHPTLGGEKPMDLAYWHAVLKSPVFPPYDPWYAGGTLHYYYFGFVLVGVLVKLTGIAPQVAWNLAVPTLFAATTLGAFGATLALLPARVPRRRAIGWGFLGAAMVTVFGNLGELNLLFEGFASLSKRPGVIGILDGFVRGFLRGEKLPFRPEWPYWNPTRVLSHPPTEAGPINEMPFFTYLFGDLHAHAMALPLTLAALGLTLALVRGPATGRRAAARVLLLALVLGALWTTNTWDVPAYGLVAAGALLLCETRQGPLHRASLARAGARALALFAASWLLFAPFHRAFGSGYGGVQLWRGSRTRLHEYLILYGLFAFLLAAFLLSELLVSRNGGSVLRTLRGVLRHPARLRRLLALRRALVRPARAHGLAVKGALAAAAIVAACLARGVLLPAFVLAFLLLALLALPRRRPDPLTQAAIGFAIVGLALTLLPEIVVLSGDIARMNTVFKLSLQAWVLLSVACAAAAFRNAEAMPAWRPAARRVYRGAFVAFVAACLLYPLLATPARLADRFVATRGTLDGGLFLEEAVYGFHGHDLPLAPDGRAIRWLQDHVAGSPVIAEGNAEPFLYGWGNRFTNFTGLPGIVGWGWHQKQQRGAVSGDLVSHRLADVKTLFTTTDAGETRRLLDRYEVGFVVTGGLERVLYGESALAKWDDPSLGLAKVYDERGVRIYRTSRGTLKGGA